MHVNDMQMSESYVRPGVTVQFEIEAGERGPKASGVRLAQNSEVRTLTQGSDFRTLTQGADIRPLGPDDDSLCDLLSADEFTREVTETLLASAPTLTAEEIVRVRGALAQFAKNHGWMEG